MIRKDFFEIEAIRGKKLPVMEVELHTILNTSA